MRMAKRVRPTGRAMSDDEVLRVSIVFDDGTSRPLPLLSAGRRIIRFEVNETIYAPIARRDWDDLEVFE